MHINRSKIPGGLYPLSSAQSRIWFMENLNEHNLAYNDPFDYHISGNIDSVILDNSLQILIQRHESFRTVFRMENGLPQQEVLPEINFHLIYKSITNELDEVKEKLIKEYSLRNSQRKFYLESGPLFYVELIKLAPESYILLFNLHHIISDAVSVRIFLDELFDIYNSKISQKSMELPEIPVTYCDYALWENNWITTEECRAQIEYWKNELNGIPDVLQLPLDYPRPKMQMFTGAEYHFRIDEDLRSGLSLLSKKHGTSMLIPLLSSFAVLMSKYSLQDDLVIGVPVANRAQEELQMLIGVMINSLPMRFKLNRNLTIGEVIDITRDKFMQGYENKNVPFEKLVEELKTKRSLNSSPVFQVLFNYLTSFQSEIRYKDIVLKQMAGERRVSQVDITMTILDQKTYANGIFQYDDELFNRETIERMAGHYLNILKTIIVNDTIRSGEIPLLTGNERNLLLDQWNNTKMEYPKQKCIHHLFEEQVIKTPEASAIEDESGELTYSGLNINSNKLASFLIKKGAGPGTSIALFIDRSIEMVTALLAIVKTGAALLPLDPIYPKHRLQLILNDASPILLLTQRSLDEKIPDTIVSRVYIDDKDQWAVEPDNNPTRGNSKDPAYILYTSGSTGIPKGVKIKHHSLVNLISYFKRKLQVNENDVLLSVTTIAFDIAELEMYLPLVSGAKLVIASKETVLDMSLLGKKMVESGVTIFQATPVTFKMLLANQWNGKAGLKVICGGEALSKELARELLSRCDEVYNGYGPTETAIYSVVQKLGDEDIEGDGFAPIGRPIDNTMVYVLNEDLVPVPVGITGELYIGGDGVSPGYLNLPDVTSQRFIPDHLSKKAETKLYKTGDIVKYYPDGRLVFLNRADSQVKIRGFRIELGDIESTLSQFPGIKENVVAVRDDSGREKILVAYFIPEEGKEPDLIALKQFMKERLPDYMIPAAIVKMNQFPLTSNNKIDRKLLPEPDLYMKTSILEYIKPETHTEIKLASIWESILKSEKISINEDFFEAGGHSMIAVTLIIKIEKEFGIRIPLATLFEKSTISGMAKLIDEGVNKINEKWRSLVPIRTEGNKKPLFLIHGLGLNVLLYTTIVKLLDPEQPVYGLQAKGLDGIEPPLESVEKIAAWYISEIMTVEKDGPYILAGFSLGGKIAFEIARQLVEMGKEVSFLGLFDSVAEDSRDRGVSHLLKYVTWNLRSVFSDKDKTDENGFLAIKRKIKGLERKIIGIDLNVNKQKNLSKGTEDELPHYLNHVHRANRKADRNYVFKTYKGVVHLFKAKNQTFFIEDPLTYGWEKYARGGVIIHEIPGEHSSIFAPPNDQYFADILQRNLTGIHNEILQNS